MKAVILAAGTTIYHEEDFGQTPCSLIDINGETILERQIRLLEKSGIKDIVVVVSFQKEKVMKKYPNLNYVISKHRDEKGRINQIYSLMLTSHLWKDDLLVISGDVVFSEKALMETLRVPFPSTGFIFFGVERNNESLAMRLNQNGIEYLRSLKDPFWHYINPNNPEYFRTANMNHLRWHLKMDLVILSEVALDIDGKKDIIEWKKKISVNSQLSNGF